jgi:hypothetical protein
LPPVRGRDSRSLVRTVRRSDCFPPFLAAQKVAFVYNPKSVI